MLLELYNTNNLKLLKLGGAITGNSDTIALKFFNYRRISGRPKDVIVISTFLKDKLTLEEYKAIYYHEEGHYVLGHNFNNRISKRSPG